MKIYNYIRLSSLLAFAATSFTAKAQLSAVITAVNSTGNAFNLTNALPAESVSAFFSASVVINRDENIPSKSLKGAPIVSARAVRPLNAANRPTTGYLIIEQTADSDAMITLYNNGSGSAKSHSYDLESKVSLTRPSSLSQNDPKYTGVTWKYRKKVSNLTWTPNLNLGFDDYEWSQAFSIPLPHELSASAKVAGPSSGKDGNFGYGGASVYLKSKFVTSLPSAKISVNLSGASLNNRSILCEVTTLATDGVEYLVPDTDSGITLIAFADESSLANVRVWITGSLKRSATTTIDDGADTSVTVTPIFGDINGDNVINSADETLMNERIANGANDVFLPDDFYDYNQDGLVNNADLLILQGNLNIVGD
jgi:hypothetical protein